MARPTPLDKITQGTTDHRPGPVEEVLRVELRERLKTGLDGLTDPQIQIVTMRFGLAEHRPRSITFIAKVMRIRQAEAEAILADALAQLREHLR